MKKQSIKANILYIILQTALWGIYGVLYSYANRYLLFQGFSSAFTGILLAVSTATALLLQPLLTWCIDRKRLQLKATVIILTGIMLCCCVLLSFTATPWITALLYTVAYAVVVVYPAFINSMGVVAMKSGFEVSFALARGTGAFVFGVTALCTNKLIEAFGEPVIPLLACAFCALGAVGGSMFPQGAEALTQKETPSKAMDFFRRNKKFTGLLLAVAVLNIGHNILGNCMYQIALFKGNGNAQGTVLMISTLIEIPTIVLFTKLLNYADSSCYMKISGVFFTLRIILTLVLPDVAGLYAAQLCQIAGYALYTVCSVYYAGEVVSDNDTVKGQTYICCANTVGCLVAHLFGGIMIDAVGVGNMLIITSAVSALGAVTLFLTAENVKGKGTKA